MPGVTISAGYGAGGSVVAPHVAKLLGLPLLDRAISSRVAAQLRVSVKRLKAVRPPAPCPIASSARLSRWPPG